ncbi:hypothetical protein FKP32DRAFT_115888 [Trametes sanguinea]|nr:hypothetical protein FKP32DRAFT_115888 [Trametes sanguinea]
MMRPRSTRTASYAHHVESRSRARARCQMRLGYSTYTGPQRSRSEPDRRQKTASYSIRKRLTPTHDRLPPSKPAPAAPEQTPRWPSTCAPRRSSRHAAKPRGPYHHGVRADSPVCTGRRGARGSPSSNPRGPFAQPPRWRGRPPPVVARRRIAAAIQYEPASTDMGAARRPKRTLCGRACARPRGSRVTQHVSPAFCIIVQLPENGRVRLPRWPSSALSSSPTRASDEPRACARRERLGSRGRPQ